jgi:hypothetical protein
MTTASLERIRLTRWRQKLGHVPIRLVATPDWINFLHSRSYLDGSADGPRDKKSSPGRSPR